MKLNKINRRYEEDVLGKITCKGKKNKVTEFFQNLLKEKYNLKSKKNIVYRVDVVKPKRKKLVLSKYGKLLALRRKLCVFYGNLRQKDLKILINEVKLNKESLTDGLINRLESRLDTIVYRMNFVSTVLEGRKEIIKGSFLVNKNIIKQPSYSVKIGDIIEVIPGLKENFYKRLVNRIKLNLLFTSVPSYLEINYKIFAGCKLSDIKFNKVSYPFKIKDNLFKSFILEKG